MLDEKSSARRSSGVSFAKPQLTMALGANGVLNRNLADVALAIPK